MANILFGVAVADARGSVGGAVFSRGKGGAILRNRVKPVNPRSTTQSARRANTAYISKAWSDVLDDQMRADWRAYAAGTSWTNKLGQAIEIGGNAAFMRLNAIRMTEGLALMDEAPLAFGHAGGIEFTFTADTTLNKITVAEPTGSYPAVPVNSEVLIFMGLPTQPGRIGTPKGFRFLAAVPGSTLVPGVFPLVVDPTYTFQVGQIVTLKAMFTDEEYRVSGPHWATAVAAPLVP